MAGATPLRSVSTATFCWSHSSSGAGSTPRSDVTGTSARSTRAARRTVHALAPPRPAGRRGHPARPPTRHHRTKRASASRESRCRSPGGSRRLPRSRTRSWSAPRDPRPARRSDLTVADGVPFQVGPPACRGVRLELSHAKGSQRRRHRLPAHPGRTRQLRHAPVPPFGQPPRPHLGALLARHVRRRLDLSDLPACPHPDHPLNCSAPGPHESTPSR